MGNKLLSSMKSYVKSGIFIKHMKRYTLFFIIPLLIVYVIIYASYFIFSNREMTSRLNSEFAQISLNSNSIIDNVYNQYVQYSSNKNIQYLLALPTNELYGYENNFNLQGIQSLFQTSARSTSYIYEISLYSIAGEYVVSSLNNNTINTFTQTDWYKQFDPNDPSPYITYDYYNASPLILVCFPLNNLYSNDIVGLLIFSIHYEEINNLVVPSSADSSTVTLLNNENKILYCSDISWLGKQYTNEIPYHATGSSYIQKGGIAYLYEYTDYPEFLLIFENDISYRSHTIILFTCLMVFLVLLTLFLPMAISAHYSKNFYDSITDLSTQLLLSNSEWAENEAEYIINNIDNIMLKEKNIEHGFAKNILQLRKAQTIALQTQLNPHFIYNTLNAIGLSVNNTKIRPDLLIKNFSDILRYSLNTKEILAYVSDEIKYTKQYIEIEETKYMQKFNTDFDIPENISSLKTVKFILQPIVENTLRHGFKHKSDDGFFLKIRALLSDNILEFIVTDTGYGIEAGKLKEIQDNLNSEKFPETKNIGIYNVHLRIRLIFGNKYGVSVDSEKNYGTTVKIKLPVVNEEEIS